MTLGFRLGSPQCEEADVCQLKIHALPPSKHAVLGSPSSLNRSCNNGALSPRDMIMIGDARGYDQGAMEKKKRIAAYRCRATPIDAPTLVINK
jgi:hypothetical protein